MEVCCSKMYSVILLSDKLEFELVTVRVSKFRLVQMPENLSECFIVTKCSRNYRWLNMTCLPLSYAVRVAQKILGSTHGAAKIRLVRARRSVK